MVEIKNTWHGDRNNNYVFDLRRAVPKDGYKGFYFAPNERKEIADYYAKDGNSKCYNLKLNNPIYEIRNITDHNRKIYTQSELKDHDGIIAIYGEEWYDDNIRPKCFPMPKSEIIEIIVFNKQSIEIRN